MYSIASKSMFILFKRVTLFNIMNAYAMATRVYIVLYVLDYMAVIVKIICRNLSNKTNNDKFENFNTLTHVNGIFDKTNN